MDFDMRTIHVRIEIEDSDFIENELYKTLDGILGESMKDFIKLSDTSELYETDETFRQLSMKVKAAKRAYNDYLNKTKIR